MFSHMIIVPLESLMGRVSSAVNPIMLQPLKWMNSVLLPTFDKNV